ncbi:hypothetical protein BDW67DRAFT_162912 [Aspergillus spinulosporus]
MTSFTTLTQFAIVRTSALTRILGPLYLDSIPFFEPVCHSFRIAPLVQDQSKPFLV